MISASLRTVSSTPDLEGFPRVASILIDGYCPSLAELRCGLRYLFASTVFLRCNIFTTVRFLLLFLRVFVPLFLLHHLEELRKAYLSVPIPIDLFNDSFDFIFVCMHGLLQIVSVARQDLGQLDRDIWPLPSLSKARNADHTISSC